MASRECQRPESTRKNTEVNEVKGGVAGLPLVDPSHPENELRERENE